MNIRPMRAADLRAVGRLAAELVRQHHQTDPGRFMRIPRVEAGYAWFFGTQLKSRKAVLRVAEEKGVVIGYGYGALEARDWNLLLDVHGAIHDVLVAKAQRRGGVGKALMSELVRALVEKGAKRILLSTMVQNRAAQRLFESLGFRPTMLEMTLNP